MPITAAVRTAEAATAAVVTAAAMVAVAVVATVVAVVAATVAAAEVVVEVAAINDLPALGVGLGFRSPLMADLFLRRDAVDFLEVTCDHYFGAGVEKRRELELLAANFPLIPHGLNLSLGSAKGLDGSYVRQYTDLVRRVGAPWCSEHIAFTRAGGIEFGHLAPLPWNQEAVDVVCRNVEQVQSGLDVPLLLENITYSHQLPGVTMTEGQFLHAIVQRTGCYLLLDVTNLHTNAVNHGGDALAQLDEWPLERVAQLHFAGGEMFGDELVDSHSGPAAPEVWLLLDKVLERAPVRGVILERDENLPPLAELIPELERARELGRRHGRWI